MTGRGMGGHHSAHAGSYVWLTPEGLHRALGDFDLDPCAAPEPRPWPTALNHIAPPEDGLAAHWSGRVWCNPPYGREVGLWLAKLVEHGRGTALVYARIETAWFVRYVWQSATAVLFLHNRIRFCRPDGSPMDSNSGAGSCLVAYGHDDAEQLAQSGLNGTLIGRSGPGKPAGCATASAEWAMR